MAREVMVDEIEEDWKEAGEKEGRDGKR